MTRTQPRTYKRRDRDDIEICQQRQLEEWFGHDLKGFHIVPDGETLAWRPLYLRPPLANYLRLPLTTSVEDLVCVLCGAPWEPGCKNRCECGGFCSWGKGKGAPPTAWIVTKRGWLPRLYSNNPAD